MVEATIIEQYKNKIKDNIDNLIPDITNNLTEDFQNLITEKQKELNDQLNNLSFQYDSQDNNLKDRNIQLIDFANFYQQTTIQKNFINILLQISDSIQNKINTLEEQQKDQCTQNLQTLLTTQFANVNTISNKIINQGEQLKETDFNNKIQQFIEKDNSFSTFNQSLDNLVKNHQNQLKIKLNQNNISLDDFNKLFAKRNTNIPNDIEIAINQYKKFVQEDQTLTQNSLTFEQLKDLFDKKSTTIPVDMQEAINQYNQFIENDKIQAEKNKEILLQNHLTLEVLQENFKNKGLDMPDNIQEAINQYHDSMQTNNSKWLEEELNRKIRKTDSHLNKNEKGKNLKFINKYYTFKKALLLANAVTLMGKNNEKINYYNKLMTDIISNNPSISDVIVNAKPWEKFFTKNDTLAEINRLRRKKGQVELKQRVFFATNAELLMIANLKKLVLGQDPTIDKHTKITNQIDELHAEKDRIKADYDSKHKYEQISLDIQGKLNTFALHRIEKKKAKLEKKDDKTGKYNHKITKLQIRNQKIADKRTQQSNPVSDFALHSLASMNIARINQFNEKIEMLKVKGCIIDCPLDELYQAQSKNKTV